MAVDHVEVLVEEPSMEAVLRSLMPRLLGEDVTFEVYRSQCKQALLANLPSRLRGYSSWLPNSWRIVVVIDRDDEDCDLLKARLEEIARHAGLASKTSVRRGAWQVVNRIAIEELEAWFFGDVDAVRTVYPRVPDTLDGQPRYHDPDAIRGGTWEAFQRVLQRAGYFKGGLPKVKVARAIAPHMVPSRNRSHSFQIFRDTVIGMVAK